MQQTYEQLVRPSQTEALIPRVRFSPRLMTALDIARAAAAIYVVLHHVANARSWQNIPAFGVLFKFGQEAVIVFFLLSGVVIFANEHTRALRPANYLLRRLRRIYPALVCALAVSTLVALDNGMLAKAFRWSQLWGTLLSLQDVSSLKPGVIVAPYLGNEPLWSLSYEVAFYAAFPLVLRAWSKSATITTNAIGLVCCVAYAIYVFAPNHWCLITAYFLIWWTGAMAANAHLSGKTSFLRMGPAFPWLLGLAIISAVAIPVVGRASLYNYPILPLRHFSIAILAVIILFGPVGRFLVHRAAPFYNTASFLASISYGIYILHFSLLVQSHRSITVYGLITMAAVLLVTATLVDRGLDRVLPRAPKS